MCAWRGVMNVILLWKQDPKTTVRYQKNPPLPSGKKKSSIEKQPRSTRRSTKSTNCLRATSPLIVCRKGSLCLHVMTPLPSLDANWLRWLRGKKQDEYFLLMNVKYIYSSVEISLVFCPLVRGVEWKGERGVNLTQCSQLPDLTSSTAVSWLFPGIIRATFRGYMRAPYTYYLAF